MQELQNLSNERFKSIQETFNARNVQNGTEYASKMQQFGKENQEAFTKIMAANLEDAHNVKNIWTAVLKSLR